MKYLLDTANQDSIKAAINSYCLQGITTNPTLVSRENLDYKMMLLDIKKILNGKDFHIQVTETKYDAIIEEAKLIKELIGDTVKIKIPVSTEGYKAIKYLSKNNYKITATAVCNVNQAIMAALCGADDLAVYINRITKSGRDGIEVIKQIKKIFVENKITSKILGASFENIDQIKQAILNGCDAVTVNPDMLNKLLYSKVTDDSIIKFTTDFEKVYGPNNTGLKILKTNRGD